MQPTSMSQLKTSKLPHNLVCNRKSTLLTMAVVLLLRMKMPSTFRKLSSLFVFVKMSSKNPESAKLLSSIYLSLKTFIKVLFPVKQTTTTAMLHENVLLDSCPSPLELHRRYHDSCCGHSQFYSVSSGRW